MDKSDAIIQIFEHIEYQIDELKNMRRLLEKVFYSKVGEKYGKLTVLSENGRIRLGNSEFTWQPEFECVCECGQVILADYLELERGEVTECGDC